MNNPYALNALLAQCWRRGWQAGYSNEDASPTGELSAEAQAAWQSGYAEGARAAAEKPAVASIDRLLAQLREAGLSPGPDKDARD